MTQHAEAFRLMQYDADDGTETEVLWNSRDGVTAFIITLPSGKQATHARWGEDVICNENMARSLGVRWFADHTEETARRAAKEYVEKYWTHHDYPMSENWDTKEKAVNYFVGEWVGSATIIDCPGPPIGRGSAPPGKFSQISRRT